MPEGEHEGEQGRPQPVNRSCLQISGAGRASLLNHLLQLGASGNVRLISLGKCTAPVTSPNSP